MKKIVITQSNYIPWRGYFDEIHFVDEFILYDDVQYTRRDWRNRNKIKTPQGVQWLTIPVSVKGKYNQLIKDVKISDPKWKKKHWKMIQLNYAKAPYFKEYKDFLEELYLNTNTEYLYEVNRRFLEGFCELLGIDKNKFKYSWEYPVEEGLRKTDRLVAICKQAGATHYYSGPRAKNYMEEEKFHKEGIEVNYFDFTGYPPYHQLHGDFEDYLSIVDLLLNEGPNSPKYMKSFTNPELLIEKKK